MMERPILFNGDMVGAILAGQKIVTRRIIKPQPDILFKEMMSENTDYMMFHHAQLIDEDTHKKVGRPQWLCYDGEYPEHGAFGIGQCPYGKVGDRLYVKETHYLYGKWVKNGVSETGRQKWKFKRLLDVVFYADRSPEIVRKNAERIEGWYKRPSIFMEKRDSRILLEITYIRIERVRDITTQQAVDEGILEWRGPYINTVIRNTEGTIPKTQFSLLWDLINGKRGYPWESDPLVWIVGFKVIKDGK